VTHLPGSLLWRKLRPGEAAEAKHQFASRLMADGESVEDVARGLQSGFGMRLAAARRLAQETAQRLGRRV